MIQSIKDFFNKTWALFLIILGLVVALAGARRKKIELESKVAIGEAEKQEAVLEHQKSENNKAIEDLKASQEELKKELEEKQRNADKASEQEIKDFYKNRLK